MASPAIRPHACRESHVPWYTILADIFARSRTRVKKEWVRDPFRHDIITRLTSRPRTRDFLTIPSVSSITITLNHISLPVIQNTYQSAAMPHSKTPGQSNAASDKFNKADAEGTSPFFLFCSLLAHTDCTYSKGPRSPQRARRKRTRKAWRSARSIRQRQLERGR
jgi:hypothetical protein